MPSCTCLQDGKENCRATVHDQKHPTNEKELLDKIANLETLAVNNKKYMTELFEYVMHRSRELWNSHGVSIENRKASIFDVSLTRSFKSRVEALKWAEKLVKVIPDE